MPRAAPCARADLPRRDWNGFVERHPDGWWFHTSGWLDYALAYAPGSRDLSTALVIKDDNDAIVGIKALSPGVVAADGATLTYGGQPQPTPLVDETIAPDINTVVGGNGRPWSRSFSAAYRPGRDAEFMTDAGCVVRESTTYVVDLWDGDERAQYRRLRKSYKSLINKAERDYDVLVVSQVDDPKWMLIAKEVHAAAAGRQTRPDETWRCQDDWLQAGYGVLALAQDKQTKQAVAFAYAIRFRDFGYYMSGASLVDNVQHALQWAIMRALRADGQTQYYEIGHDAPEGADAKAQQIAFFKRGFGGDPWPVRTVVSA